MKHTILLLLSIVTINIAKAQLNNQMNAFGLRVGDDNGLTLEGNYQRFLNESRNFRLETGLNFKDKEENVKHIKWVNTIQYVSSLFGNYNWYVGLGAGFGNFETELIEETEFLSTAVIGIGWSSTLPFVFSIDVRPEYRPNTAFDDSLNFDIGLSLRVQF